MNLTIITACWSPENINNVIQTIDNQTYKDFHHIIVNDNHPDSRKIIPSLCDGEHRFWIDMHFRSHYYGAFARNIGVITSFSYLHASERDIDNEWVTFLDTDNTWEVDHLESMVNVIDDKTSIVASDALWIGANDKNWREIRPCKLKHGGCDLGQFLYKTRLFRDYGYFFAHPRHKHKWDWELLKKITQNETSGIRYTGLPTFRMNYKKR